MLWQGVMIGACYVLVLYNTAFALSRGKVYIQSLLAIGLPIFKWVLKVLLKTVTNGERRCQLETFRLLHHTNSLLPRFVLAFDDPLAPLHTPPGL